MRLSSDRVRSTFAEAYLPPNAAGSTAARFRSLNRAMPRRMKSCGYRQTKHQEFCANGHVAYRRPVSQSGATAVLGSEHCCGTALAVEELNNASGVWQRPIETIVHDPASAARDGRIIVGGENKTGSTPYVIPAAVSRAARKKDSIFQDLSVRDNFAPRHHRAVRSYARGACGIHLARYANIRSPFKIQFFMLRGGDDVTQ
jgi:Periplasmic binding protein domain